MNRIVSYIKSRRKYVIILAITVASLVSVGYMEDYYFEVSKNLDIFSTLFRDVNMYYVDSVQPGELMKKGIDAMMKSLDPYSVFIPESDIEDYRMTHVSAEYGGIGALVHERNGEIEISEVYEGFPAQKAGIIPGDKVLSVNGINIGSKRVTDVTEFLKGAKGSKVTLTLRREGETKPLEKVLYRDEIKFKNVPFYGMINSTTGYIKLNQFLENAGSEVHDALISLKTKPDMKYLVLDLRENGGGLLKEAVDIVNLFVEQGQKIVSQKGKIKEMNMEYKANRPAADSRIPLVVLVDRTSASASEIVSGALQELDRAVIIGQRTFGKGLVQQTYNLSYNSLLKVTIAKYYTPSGRCIQALDYTHRPGEGKLSHRPDSLIKEFKTKNGRSVFDGSGVYPDIYIEHDRVSNVLQALFQNFLIFDYANKYYREHPSIAPAQEFKLTDSEYQQFIAWLSDKKYDYITKSEREVEELKKATEKEKYYGALQADLERLQQRVKEAKNEDLKRQADEIRHELEEEIALRYYYQKGALQASFKDDKELNRAIEVLTNQKLYASILAGEENYKVIGKPGTTAQALTGSESDD